MVHHSVWNKKKTKEDANQLSTFKKIQFPFVMGAITRSINDA
jgi:hypothetical protein